MFIFVFRGFIVVILEVVCVIDGGVGKEVVLVVVIKELECSFNKVDFKNMKVIFYSFCMVVNGCLIGLSLGFLYVGFFLLRSD